MIDIDEINSEIEKLENQPMSYGTIQKLSWLYTVRDHARPCTEKMQYGDSECMRACAKKPVAEVMLVVDELMDTLHIIQPRLYNVVMERLG